MKGGTGGGAGAGDVARILGDQRFNQYDVYLSNIYPRTLMMNDKMFPNARIAIMRVQ